MRYMPIKGELEKLARSGKFSAFTVPRYDGLSIANIAPTIAHLLNVKFNGTELRSDRLVDSDGGFKDVVLFVADALGQNLLARNRRARAMVDALFPKGKAKRALLTSVFPSTTAAALTSMFTGLTPSEHGMVGYTLFLKEVGSAVNMISLSPVNDWGKSRIFDLGFTPQRLLPCQKLTETLAQSGIPSRLLIRQELRGSGLSTLLYKFSEIIPYISLSDMFLSLSRILDEGKGGLTIVYWDGLDAMEHHYGPFSDEASTELSLYLHAMGGFLEGVKRKSAEGVFVMLTSDHGQAQVRDEACLNVDEIRWLRDSLLMPPTGEGRCAYMYLKRDARGFERKFKGALGKHFCLKSTRESISQGLYGRTELLREYEDRLGDFVAIARGASKLIFNYNLRERTEPPFVRYGGHGGLTLDEMLVPFVSAPLRSLVA
jgi:hypothetical protein